MGARLRGWPMAKPAVHPGARSPWTARRRCRGGVRRSVGAARRQLPVHGLPHGGRSRDAPPPLVLSGSEWTVVDVGRTRLSFDGALHAAFPVRDNALAGARRVGYVLRGAVWQEEPVAASLVDAPAMPWTTAATADQSALAIDERGRRIVVWSKGDALGVARWEGSAWTPLPGGDVPAVAVEGAPAIAAAGGRVCVAWAAPSRTGSDIFVRCHRSDP
jgi:hypothetical protein